ncbi:MULTISPECIES: hypothetical protein [unclassified Candidatus Cardinium]|uniref:hypothetical protein n=1 Tax=unclassified Candidatus Cardinium TaxID=2641185 RepID=UPI001FB5390C|nr:MULTISPECIES: hypothetical protein [unclassified Candidatus Cardinium]
MNTYRRYRASLLAGLLILNTLSACIHTRKELGIGGLSILENRRYDSRYCSGLIRIWNRMNLPGKSLMLISFGSGAVFVTYWLSFLIPDQSNAMGPHNGSLITPLPPISTGKTPHKPVSNVPSDHLDTDTIEDMLTAGKEKYGNEPSTDPSTTTTSTTTATAPFYNPVTVTVPVSDLNPTSTDPSTSTMATTTTTTTTDAPDNKVADPMVLSEKILADIGSNHWSLDRVKY